MGVGERIRSALRSALLICSIAGLLTCPAWAGGGPRDVAVVINTNSSVSVEIGRYYQAARGIPERNICSIWCPDDEIVSWEVCESQIREPIRRFLSQPEVAGRISYIVLTKGIPLGADYVDGDVLGDVDPQDGYPDTNHYYSVANVLVDLDTPVVDLTGPSGEPDGRPDNASSIANPYGPSAPGTYGFTAPQKAWSFDLFDSGDSYDIDKRLYLVTRLDAFTVQQIKDAIDRSMTPALDGIYLLDRNTWNTGPYKYANSRLGNLLNSAYDYLVKRACEVRYDAGSDFLAEHRGVMGYFSWASNDGQYTFGKYTSNVFVPGAVADTYYSFSGRTFSDPGTTSRSPLIADLFACGLCGGGGYVSEPIITTATYPNVLFDRYTQGYGMAESFYAACPNLKWKTVIVGDPLMAPYASPPAVSIDLDDTVLSDVVTVSASAYDDSGVSKVRFYIDDDLFAEVTAPPYTAQLDSREYTIGAHTIEAIAYEDTALQTQASAKVPVIIDNPVSAVARIADGLGYGDGQAVRFKNKIVTAGTLEIGDGFYIEDSDRSSGLKVLSSLQFERGDVVTVTGPLGTQSGQRVVTGSLISLESCGAQLPRPLLIKLRDLGGVAKNVPVPPIGGTGGARNTALLVRVVGRVVSCTDGRLLITDGSTPEPVPVICPGAAALPAGTVVAVTGLSTAESQGSKYGACVRARCLDDIELL